MKISSVLISILTTLTLSFVVLCLRSEATPVKHTPVQTVDHVELSRYVGVWNEIAHYPVKYQDGCVDSTATFSLRNDGEIDILNSCRNMKDGTLRHINGRGWVIDTKSNARLKFSFFWPFRSEYLIIDQGDEYEYSVIGTPDRKHLWIISRTPEIDSDTFEEIIQNIEKQGFYRENLIKTQHSKNSNHEVADSLK
jgi:apolipoprotein D and lipocalin family protein